MTVVSAKEDATNSLRANTQAYGLEVKSAKLEETQTAEAPGIEALRRDREIVAKYYDKIAPAEEAYNSLHDKEGLAIWAENKWECGAYRFWIKDVDAIWRMTEKEPNNFEVITMGRPANLVFDVEANLALNPTFDTREMADIIIQKVAEIVLKRGYSIDASDFKLLDVGFFVKQVMYEEWKNNRKDPGWKKLTCCD
jgi:hypothetical protein